MNNLTEYLRYEAVTEDNSNLADEATYREGDQLARNVKSELVKYLGNTKGLAAYYRMAFTIEPLSLTYPYEYEGEVGEIELHTIELVKDKEA